MSDLAKLTGVISEARQAIAKGNAMQVGALIERALLQAIPRRATTILTSSRGRPWHKDGLEASFNRARTKAKIEPGPDGKPKRFHDLRGTSATERVADMLDREELRQAHGWSKGEGGAARAYVDTATVVAIRNRDGKE